MKDGLCKSCKYSKSFGDTLYCHRYPPTPHPPQIPGGSWCHSTFPRVRSNDGCGEWMAPPMVEVDGVSHHPECRRGDDCDRSLGCFRA